DGVVGDPDGVVVAVVVDDGDDGTEDLLLGDPHAVVDVHEHGGLDVPAHREVGRAAAAHRHRGALGSPDGHVPLHPVALAGAGQRAYPGRRVEGVADRHVGDGVA